MAFFSYKTLDSLPGNEIYEMNENTKHLIKIVLLGFVSFKYVTKHLLIFSLINYKIINFIIHSTKKYNLNILLHYVENQTQQGNHMS